MTGKACFCPQYKKKVTNQEFQVPLLVKIDIKEQTAVSQSIIKKRKSFQKYDHIIK